VNLAQKNKSSCSYASYTTNYRHCKEGLFNILQHRIELDGIKTLDLFGGTGSISYELASRGAGDLTVIEKDAALYEFIKKNMEMLKVENCKVCGLTCSHISLYVMKF
jgi:16S rRNA G966 N2-methylase RsmD